MGDVTSPIVHYFPYSVTAWVNILHAHFCALSNICMFCACHEQGSHTGAANSRCGCTNENIIGGELLHLRTCSVCGTVAQQFSWLCYGYFLCVYVAYYIPRDRMSLRYLNVVAVSSTIPLSMTGLMGE